MARSQDSQLAGIVFGLLLASFAAYQQFKLPVVLPVLLQRYDYDRTLAGGFMSVYALIGLLISIRLGRLIQQIGPFRPILAGLALFVLAAGLPLARPDLGWLVMLSRGLEGIGFAVLAISGPVLANSYASPRQLPVVAGFTATWIPVGQLAATLAAPLAFAIADWWLLWWLGAAIAMVFAVWSLVLRRQGLLIDKRRGPAGHDAAERQATAPSGRQRLGLILTGAIFMLWSGQYFAYMTWLPQYLVEVHQLDVASALWGYVIPVSLVLIMCIVTGLLVGFGVPVAGLLIAALAVQFIVWLLLPHTGAGWSGVASLVAYGASAGVVPACLFSIPSAIMRGGRNTAQAFGIVMTGRNIGVFTGPILLAQAFSWAGSWDLAAPIFGTITFLCLPPAVALAVVLQQQKHRVL